MSLLLHARIAVPSVLLIALFLAVVGCTNHIGLFRQDQITIERKMLNAYDGISTYQATWTVDSPAEEAGADENAAAEQVDAVGHDVARVYVAFERETRRIVVRVQTGVRTDDGWMPHKGGMLFMNDGSKVHRAYKFAHEEDQAEWNTVAADTPDSFTYRDLIKVYLFSQVLAIEPPLLLGTEPFAELVLDPEPQIVELPDEEIDGVTRRGLRITGDDGQFVADLWLDPKTMLIHEARYGPARFVSRSIEFDKPFEDSVFDYDAQMAVLEDTTGR